MADLLNITISGDKAIVEGNLDGIFDAAKVKHLLRDAVEDAAKKEAPRHTGELRLHPVDRDDVRFGVVEPTAFSFGGGVSARGAGGQFIAGGISPEAGGQLIARSTITVAKEPKHAIWVHDGTGIHGPRGQVITAHNPEGFMWFPASRWPTANFKRANYRFKSVKGQKAQPYLRDAFLLVNGTYVPARIELLRAQIAAET